MCVCGSFYYVYKYVYDLGHVWICKFGGVLLDGMAELMVVPFPMATWSSFSQQGGIPCTPPTPASSEMSFTINNYLIRTRD